MPKPIPDWDLARRLVKYVGIKQITRETATVREASVTLGIGQERIESLMTENKIIYKIIASGQASGKDLILLEYVPHNLAMDAGIANKELHTSYHKFIDRQQQGEIKFSPPRRTRLTKKKREKMKVREFWNGKEHAP